MTQFWSRTSGVNRVPAASLTPQVMLAEEHAVRQKWVLALAS